MIRFLTVACLLVGVTFSVAEPLPIDPLWKSEGFRKAMTGSYGIDSRIEPRITIDEEEFLDLSAKEMAAENREGAIKILSETSILETSPTLRFALANLQFEMEDDEAAIENFRKALEQFPNFRDAHRNLAIVLVQNEKFDDAKTHLVRAIELGSREGLTMGLLGYCHAVDENHQAALQAYRLAQLTMPEERQWKLGEAQALQSLDQAKAALSLYRDLLSTTPGEVPLWLNLANTNLQLGQSIDAVAEMEVVRRMGSLPAPSLLSLGNLYLNQSLPKESAECYRAALAMPEPPPLDKAVESLEYVTNLGHWEIAKDIAASISSAFPDVKNTRLTRALALIDFETGDAEAAVAKVEALVDSDPMDGQSILLLARFRNSQGEREVAEMLIEQAVLLEEHEADALVAHGKLLVEYGEYSTAAEKLDRALRIQPTDSIREYAKAVKQLVVD